MLNVLLDSSPLKNGNAIRGVGAYTRFLGEALRKVPNLTLLEKDSSTLHPDIVHYPFFDLFFPTLPLKKKYKTVVTIHDVIPLLFPKEYQPGKKGKIALFRQKLALQRVDAIITDSESSKADIIKFLRVPADKVTVVPLASNPELHPSTASEVEEIKKKYELPEKYLLYVGDINYNKNIPQLIKALRFLPEDTQLVCVGKNFVAQDIPEWRAIETQIAMTDVAKQVHFLPTISGSGSADLSAIYSGAEIYIQPSLYEGFGLPLLEAMQCGTPVIATQTSSLLEVGGTVAQFVEPTAESIAEGVKHVLEWSTSHRRSMIEAGFEWSKRFSWDDTAKKTYGVYQHLVKA